MNFELLALLENPTNYGWKQENARLAIDVGQLWLCLFLAVAFAVTSFGIARIKGKGPAYYTSQFLGIGFILLALIFLLLKLVGTG